MRTTTMLRILLPAFAGLGLAGALHAEDDHDKDGKGPLEATVDAITAPVDMAVEAVRGAFEDDGDDRRQGVYFGAAAAHVLNAPNPTFAVVMDGAADMTGEIRATDDFLNDAEVFVGSRFGRVRIEGAVDWTRTNLGGNDGSPGSLGTSDALGFAGGAFYDFFGEGYGNVFYLGTRVGLVRVGLTETGGGSDWASTATLEIGSDFDVSDSVDMRLGVEWTRVGGGLLIGTDLGASELVLPHPGGAVQVDPYDRYVAKVGILHFFGRR